MMSPQGHYIDVPLVGSEPGAFGPDEVEARLRLGLEPLSDYVLHPGVIVVDGDLAVTEHSEEWTWHTGEHLLLRFVSVQEVRDGLVDRVVGLPRPFDPAQRRTGVVDRADQRRLQMSPTITPTRRPPNRPRAGGAPGG